MRENVQKYIEWSDSIDEQYPDEDEEYEEACKELNKFRDDNFSKEDWLELINITSNQTAKIYWQNKMKSIYG